jgi:ssDNA-binding Zn-finger/Zn-ribbon topoisomerase 1
VQVQAYCVKCRGKKIMKDAKEVTMKNGRLAAKGTCPDCGTRMFKFLPKKG